MPPATRQYTKIARAAAEDQTRTALLDAAEAAFLSGSWAQASLEALAAQAGFSKQTLLRHFGSKRGILDAAHERAFERIRAQRLAAPTEDIAGAVANLLDHYEEFGERSLRIGASDGAGGAGEIGSRARQFHYDWVEHAFGHWLAATQGPRRRRIAGALIALCDVQTWAILRRDLGYSRAETETTLVTAIERLLEERR